MLRKISKPFEMYYLDESGARQGEFRNWHENGVIWRMGTCLDDQEHGVCREWDDDCNLMEECTFIHGQLDGEFRMWYNPSLLQVHAFYRNGALQGEFKSRFWAGDVAVHGFWANGIDIIDQIELIVKDINNITEEEQTLLKLRYGIKCLQLVEMGDDLC